MPGQHRDIAHSGLPDYIKIDLGVAVDGTGPRERGREMLAFVRPLAADEQDRVPETNTPELWDSVWAADVPPARDVYDLAAEERTVRWRRVRERCEAAFGSLAGLRVVEIGAGAGTNAALFAKHGAEVTVLDYSPGALERSRAFFAHNSRSATWVAADALDLPADLRGAFDVSLSFGLAEHFLGEKRSGIVRSHVEVLRPGGRTFISVPNRANLPYRLYKVLAEAAGIWKVGEEYPFSRRELLDLGREAGLSDAEVFGESLWGSLYFVDPVRVIRKLRHRPDPTDVSRLRPQHATPLDDRFAYAIVLTGIRP